MLIRPASKQDEPWIRSLIPRLFEFGPPPYRDLAVMNDAEATATASAVDGGRDDRIVLVAADDRGGRLGFVHLETAIDFFTHERHGHISTLVVSPDAEHQGVGRALLDAAETWCRARSYRLLTLNVFDRNDSARRLYERAGYGIDTIKYLKRLS